MIHSKTEALGGNLVVRSLGVERVNTFPLVPLKLLLGVKSQFVANSLIFGIIVEILVGFPKVCMLQFKPLH